MNFVYTVYLAGIWKVLSWFATPVAATNLMNDPFCIIEEQLQPRILLNLLCFCITRLDVIVSNYDTSLVRECLYWMMSVIWRHLLEPFIFSIIVLLFHGGTWSNPYAKDTVSVSQHLLQPSILLQAVFGWFEKNWMIKVPIYSTELIPVIFVWKVLC